MLIPGTIEAYNQELRSLLEDKLAVETNPRLYVDKFNTLLHGIPGSQFFPAADRIKIVARVDLNSNVRGIPHIGERKLDLGVYIGSLVNTPPNEIPNPCDLELVLLAPYAREDLKFQEELIFIYADIVSANLDIFNKGFIYLEVCVGSKGKEKRTTHAPLLLEELRDICVVGQETGLTQVVKGWQTGTWGDGSYLYPSLGPQISTLEHHMYLKYGFDYVSNGLMVPINKRGLLSLERKGLKYYLNGLVFNPETQSLIEFDNVVVPWKIARNLPIQTIAHAAFQNNTGLIRQYQGLEAFNKLSNYKLPS